MTGGNFVYVYPRKCDELVIPIECYSYRCDSQVKYSVEGPASFDGESLRFEAGKNDDVILRAYTDEGLFCESVFHTVSSGEISRLRKTQKRDKRKLRFMNFVYVNTGRVRNYTGMMIKRGPVYMLKRLGGKVIQKIKRRLKR